MVDLPAPHSEPPGWLATAALPLHRTAEDWFRCHRTRHEAIYFGRSGGGRFDDPNGEYGILYASHDLHGAFIETFGRRVGVRIVAESELASRSIARIAVNRPLAWVDLTASGLARIGADARLTSGDYALAQRWARALWEHPDQPDGLYYRARHDPSRPCAAFFDRAADALELIGDRSFTKLDDDRHVRAILRTYAFDVVREKS